LCRPGLTKSEGVGVRAYHSLLHLAFSTVADLLYKEEIASLRLEKSPEKNVWDSQPTFRVIPAPLYIRDKTFHEIFLRASFINLPQAALEVTVK